MSNHPNRSKGAVITIPAKMSGAGSIYDLASEHRDIKIGMGKSYQYAVILPSYFNAVPTRHRSAESALAEYRKLKHRGYDTQVILDRDGNQVDAQSLDPR